MLRTLECGLLAISPPLWRWGKFNANAIDGIGSVTPRENESASDSPHTLRYTASAQPKQGTALESQH